MVSPWLFRSPFQGLRNFHPLNGTRNSCFRFKELVRRKLQFHDIIERKYQQSVFETQKCNRWKQELFEVSHYNIKVMLV